MVPFSGSTTISDEPLTLGRLGVTYATDVGKAREQNQDSAWAEVSGGRAVLVVADGMGGHEGGAEASVTATSLMRDAVGDTPPNTLPDMEELFASIAEAVAVAAPDGGTTLVAAVIIDDRLDVWHVGDSRAYVLRDGNLLRITTDHSWVQALVDTGKLSADEAARHPRRNVLLRAIGKGRESNPSHSAMRFLPDDVLLLCSDGLHGVVPEDEIASILKRGEVLSEKTAILIEAALDRGAPDNISVALASWAE